MSTLTEEQIQSNLKAYERAMRDGNSGQIQVLGLGGSWLDCLLTSAFAEFSPSKIYRIRPIPKLRPWQSIDEVPLEHWFRDKRNKPDNIKKLVSVYHSTNVVHFYEFGSTLAGLFENYEHSPDGKSNWQPCGVEVGE